MILLSRANGLILSGAHPHLSLNRLQNGTSCSRNTVIFPKLDLDINFVNQSEHIDSKNELDRASEGGETRCHEQCPSDPSQAHRPVAEHAAVLQPFNPAHAVRRRIACAGLGTDRHARAVDDRDVRHGLRGGRRDEKAGTHEKAPRVSRLRQLFGR